MTLTYLFGFIFLLCLQKQERGSCSQVTTHIANNLLFHQVPNCNTHINNSNTYTAIPILSFLPPTCVQPWTTEYLKQPTKGPKNPARFSLVIDGHPDPKMSSSSRPPEMRFSKIKEKFEKEFTVTDDIVSQTMNMAFDYDQYRYFPNAERPAKEVTGEVDPEAARKAAMKAELTPVDVAITLSSSCPWRVGGAPAAGAKLRVRIVPSIATVRYLRVLQKKVIETEVKAEADRLAREAGKSYL